MSAQHRRASARRGILTTAAAGAAARALPNRLHAKMPLGLPQVPYYYRFKLGNAECTVVSDGTLPLGNPNDSFVNIPKDEIARDLRDNSLPTSDAVLEQNVLVVNFGDRVVLFDTGIGSEKLFGPTTGELPATLRQAGIDPAAAEAVVMSHAHIDHCGGLVADDGRHHFPNAQFFIGQPDFDYWTDDTKVPANYPARANFLGQARKNLLPVKEGQHA
jgi:glyoxylase-like metal-dependent hydrolase (beta-lactamase superfamily II)